MSAASDPSAPGNDRAIRAAWVQRVLGFEPAWRGTGDAPGADPAAGLASFRQEWERARGAALDSLKTLEAAVRKGTHPQRDRAIILLRAIRANLTEMPETAAQAEALRRYIDTDEVIAAAETPNVYNIKVALRDTLLRALAGFPSP